MGLDLEVGILADLKEADDEGFAHYREQFAVLNQVLASVGLPAHVEPEELDEVFSCNMLGYSGLHYLRRVGAHIALGRTIPPPGDNNAANDPILAREYWDRFTAGERLKYQHLIVHSDAEGFYVPIDFERALVVTGFPLVGGMLGSTQRWTCRPEWMEKPTRLSRQFVPRGEVHGNGSNTQLRRSPVCSYSQPAMRLCGPRRPLCSVRCQPSATTAETLVCHQSQRWIPPIGTTRTTPAMRRASPLSTVLQP
jgi:hypothetical protein